ncbi:hypothetical protein ACQVA2_08910 [Citrobacter sp. OP27]
MGEGRGEGIRPHHWINLKLLHFFFCHANAHFQHRVVLFLRHGPDHPGKLDLVTDDRRRA